ncbi:MAG: hypothetical protein ACMG57_00950 [Candidatus Dojkabacteria bacterium]
MDMLALTQEALKTEIERILGILSGEKNEEYYKICERFIGENQFIKRYKAIPYVQRLTDFNGFFISEGSANMQYFQIIYCVICKLTDEQLVELEEGIVEARARRDGYVNYQHRFEIAQALANRMAAMFALSDDDSFKKQEISHRLHARHTAMFSNAFYLGIVPNLPMDKFCLASLLEIDKNQIDTLMEPSIAKAEQELAALMEG